MLSKDRATEPRVSGTPRAIEGSSPGARSPASRGSRIPLNHSIDSVHYDP